jgi:hypothetical protein
MVGGVAMSLDRTAQGWASTELIDTSRVDAIVSLLDRAVPLRTVDAATVGGVRATYRLTFPSRTSVLTVGSETEVPQGGAYVRVDDRAMVVPRAIAEMLLQSPLELLETTVWAIAAPDLRAVTIGAVASERRFVHRDGALFSPAGARVSRKRVDELFSLLLTLQVQRWLPHGTALDAPLRVSLEAADGPMALSLGGACPEGEPGRVARFSRGRYACVADALARAVAAVAEAPADGALFSVRRDEIERVTWQAHDRVFEAARREGGFRLIRPEGRALLADEAEALDRWLDKMLAVSGEPLVAPPPKSESELIVKRVDGGEERVLLGDRSAYRAVDGRTLVLPTGQLSFTEGNGLPSEPRWLLPRALESKLSRVRIKCSDIVYEWAAFAGAWSLVSPPALRGFVSRWDETLAALRTAKRGDETSLPRERPLCEIRLNSESFLLFVRKDGRAVASTASSAFEAPKRLVEVVARDFVDPGCLLGDRDRELQPATVYTAQPSPPGRGSVQPTQAQLAMGDLLAIAEGARVARVGPPGLGGRPLAEWGAKVVVGARADHGRLFARCGNQPVSFSIDEVAFLRALGLSKDAD